MLKLPLCTVMVPSVKMLLERKESGESDPWWRVAVPSVNVGDTITPLALKLDAVTEFDVLM